jgi:hypothetical protein
MALRTVLTGAVLRAGCQATAQRLQQFYHVVYPEWAGAGGSTSLVTSVSPQWGLASGAAAWAPTSGKTAAPASQGPPRNAVLPAPIPVWLDVLTEKGEEERTARALQAALSWLPGVLPGGDVVDASREPASGNPSCTSVAAYKSPCTVLQSQP